jgi:tRNA 2-thiouridine synthesizing protein A
MELEDVDARGLACPQPLLRAKAALAQLPAAAEIGVLADDPLAAVDLAVFCERAGHRLLGSDDLGGGVTRYRIRKSG